MFKFLPQFSFLRICIFTLFLFPSFMCAQAPTTGLIAYYPFNGNANDESGNGNNPTANTATLTSDRFGNANSAYSFNGINNYIQIPYNRALLPSNDTKTYSLGFKFNTGGTQNLHFQNGNADLYDGAFNISINPSGSMIVQLHSYWGYGGPYVCDYMFHTIPNFSYNVNHLLTVTLDNLSIKYYMDGVLVANRTWNLSYKPYDSNYNIEIGRNYNSYSGGYSDYFNGEIDDIRIYNRVLSESEVSQLYNALGILSVELMSFDVKQVEQNAQLTWQTANEKNNDHFEIERSTDGKQFVKIGEVKALGSTNQVQNYSYLDAVPPPQYNVFYYRLRQVDKDNKAEYSPIRSIRIDKQDKNANVKIYPNPIENHFTLELEDDTMLNNAKVTILNIIGQVIAQQNFNGQKMLLDLSNHPQGTYFVKLKTENGLEVMQKIQKL